MNDQATFDNVLLNPLRSDLLQYTWLYERYGCDGLQQLNRTANYLEYPNVVAMLVRQVRYGIDLGLHTLTVSPFGPTSFAYHVGNVMVNVRVFVFVYVCMCAS